MASIKIDRLSQDIASFLTISELILRENLSLRQTAKTLGVSTTAVSSCINRLEAHWGNRLINVGTGHSQTMALSDAGIAVYNRLRELRSPDVLTGDRQLRFHVSHSLITSQLLTPALRTCVRGQQMGHQIYRPRTEMDFSRVVLALQNGELDIAITWGFPRRINELPGSLSANSINAKLNVAVICNDEDMLGRVTNQETCLNDEVFLKQRIVGLGRNRHVAPPAFPNDWYLRANYLEVDTFDAAIAFIRSSIADVAIVPAVFGDLNRFRSTGQLHYWIIPDLTLDIVVITRREIEHDLPDEAVALISNIRDSLQSYPANLPEVATMGTSFPASTDWFENMRFGYFLESMDHNDRTMVWKWEHVLLQPESAKQQTFHGIIRNCANAVFSIAHAELMDDVFYLAARKVNQETSAVTSFVSMFTNCYESKGIMYGLWAGIDVKKQSTFHATIWSHNAMALRELQSTASAASLNFVLDGSRSVSLELQVAARLKFDRDYRSLIRPK